MTVIKGKYIKNGFSCFENCGNKVSMIGRRCYKCATSEPSRRNKISLSKKELYKDKTKTPTYGRKVLDFHKPNCTCLFCIMASGKGFGKNNPMYIDGRTPITEAIKNLPKYTEWRRMVFKRDNYTCQTCGIKNGQGKTIYLEPHHIKPFCVIFEEFLSSYKQYTIENDKEILVQLANDYKPFWDITNGKTLCKECHDKTKLGRNTMKGKWA